MSDSNVVGKSIRSLLNNLNTILLVRMQAAVDVKIASGIPMLSDDLKKGIV